MRDYTDAEIEAYIATGDPFDKATTQGPLISLGHREKVLSYYEAAKREGAKVVTGGGAAKMDGAMAKGSWIQPTIWTGLDEGAKAVRPSGKNEVWLRHGRAQL